MVLSILFKCQFANGNKQFLISIKINRISFNLKCVILSYWILKLNICTYSIQHNNNYYITRWHKYVGNYLYRAPIDITASRPKIIFTTFNGCFISALKMNQNIRFYCNDPAHHKLIVVLFSSSCSQLFYSSELFNRN